MRYFLRWALLNSLVTLAFVALGVAFYSRVHGASLVGIPIILIYFLGHTLYAGKLFYRFDRGDYVGEQLLKDAEFLNDAAWDCQMIGILCTIAGFWILLSHANDTASLATRIQSGAGVALMGTFIGVLTSQILRREYRWLEHALET